MDVERDAGDGWVREGGLHGIEMKVEKKKGAGKRGKERLSQTICATKPNLPCFGSTVAKTVPPCEKNWWSLMPKTGKPSGLSGRWMLYHFKISSHTLVGDV